MSEVNDILCHMYILKNNLDIKVQQKLSYNI